MAYKIYNTWKNVVNRKQRSLDEQRGYLESWKKRLEKAKQDEDYKEVKYWEREIKSTVKKIEKLEAELKTIMENIPEDVQAEINEREEIFTTFSDFISFLEKIWNDRDEMLKKACNEWLVEEINNIYKSWNNIYYEKDNEFYEISKSVEYKNNYERNKAKRIFMNNVKNEYFTKPIDVLLEKAGFNELSEYERVSEHSIEALKKENLEKAQQSVLSLVDRVENRVGKVTDWSGIHFGMNGMLNGRVTGNLGSVYVETIGAGGYNIQRFHYRVLLK